MNDKEGRKWLLQKLYDRGFKYILHHGGLCAYIATKQQPRTQNDHTYIDGSFERIDILSHLIPDFNEPNYLDIGKYLGIVDWTKVAVDTPIIIKNVVEHKRHFARFENGLIYYYDCGRTSWSGGYTLFATPDKVKLAGGNDEN